MATATAYLDRVLPAIDRAAERFTAPGWIDPDRAGDLTATFELRLRGGSTRVWSFRNGRLELGADGRRPDVHISADPPALLLVFYGRQSQWPHIARGHLLAWGRRPWLAFTLTTRFHKP
jgi:hypothetical protein